MGARHQQLLASNAATKPKPFLWELSRWLHAWLQTELPHHAGKQGHHGLTHMDHLAELQRSVNPATRTAMKRGLTNPYAYIKVAPLSPGSASVIASLATGRPTAPRLAGGRDLVAAGHVHRVQAAPGVPATDQPLRLATGGILSFIGRRLRYGTFGGHRTDSCAHRCHDLSGCSTSQPYPIALCRYPSQSEMRCQLTNRNSCICAVSTKRLSHRDHHQRRP